MEPTKIIGALDALGRRFEEQLEGEFNNERYTDGASISNYITRAVGASETLALDAEIIEPCAGDRFLLCSDGLNKELSDTEIASILTLHPLQDAAEKLLHQCLERGASDNVSLILVEACTVPESSPGG